MLNRSSNIISAAVLAAGFTTAGCSVTQQPNVPGVKNNIIEVTKMDPVPIADVLTAVQVQLGEAFKELEVIKTKYSKSPNIKGLNPQTGSAVFSGATQLIQTDSGNISAVIPFSGYTGSQLTPNFGVSSTATGIQNTTLTFSFNPKASQELGMCRKNAKEAGIDVGDYITKSVSAAFEQLAKRVSCGDSPDITARKLDISVTFSVLQKLDGGLGIKIIPTAGDLDSLTQAPALGVSRQSLGTYKLDLSIPLVTPDPQDTKRIIHGVIDPKTGIVTLIDRPYDDKTLREKILKGDFVPLVVPPEKGTDKSGPLYIEPEFPN